MLFKIYETQNQMIIELQAQEEAEARDLGIGLLRTPEEISETEKGKKCSLIKWLKILRLLIHHNLRSFLIIIISL